MGKQTNHAHIEIKEGQRTGQDKVLLPRGHEVAWLNIQTNKPGAKFSVSVADPLGNEVIKKSYDGTTNKFGERISLQLTDSNYIINVEKESGDADTFDVFLD
jgi:hypothetical protein